MRDIDPNDACIIALADRPTFVVLAPDPPLEPEEKVTLPPESRFGAKRPLGPEVMSRRKVRGGGEEGERKEREVALVPSSWCANRRHCETANV